MFKNGNRVFYCFEGKERWLGPGNVVFQDGKVVFVRHGGIFVRVSPNRLQKIYNYMADGYEKIDDNGMQDKNGETKENNESQPSISGEIPVVTAKNE